MATLQRTLHAKESAAKKYAAIVMPQLELTALQAVTRLAVAKGIRLHTGSKMKSNPIQKQWNLLMRDMSVNELESCASRLKYKTQKKPQTLN
eukprot:7632864-Ditylum_brightwellii.AAC.1